MESLVLLLAKYGYFILFPIAVVEGPIITIIAGFLVSLGIMNVFLVYAVVMAGDIVGDTGVYMMGRSGGALFSRYFKKHAEKISKAKAYFEVHRHKALVMSKIFHGVGVTGLFTAGMLHIPYKHYITVCFITTTVQSIVLVTIGILFGHAYIQINKYLNYYAASTIIFGAIIIFIIAIKKLKLFSD